MSQLKNNGKQHFFKEEIISSKSNRCIYKNKYKKSSILNDDKKPTITIQFNVATIFVIVSILNHWNGNNFGLFITILMAIISGCNVVHGEKRK